MPQGHNFIKLRQPLKYRHQADLPRKKLDCYRISEPNHVYFWCKESDQGASDFSIDWQSEVTRDVAMNLPPSDITPSPPKPKSFRRTVKHMNKASANIGNEKNLSAWILTVLECARAFMAFLELRGRNTFGTSAWIICSLGLILTSLGVMCTGLDHYKKVQMSLKADRSIWEYKPCSNWYWAGVITTLFLLAMIALITKDLEKEF